MNDKRSPFDDIFAEHDSFGLLAEKRAGLVRSTEDEIAVSQFEAINAFFDGTHVEPGSTEDGREPALSEYMMASHLKTFRASDAYAALLAPYDRHGLLGTPPEAVVVPTTMAEIIASDDSLIDDTTEDIFDLRHVAQNSVDKSVPDEIAKRRQSESFASYQPIFMALQSDLETGKRITKRFDGQGTIVRGSAFILNGIIAYVADVSAPQRRGKDTDARLHVMFANGTESNHLLRSFARVLYEDENGRQIVEANPEASGPLFTGEAEYAEGEVRTGNIYVVESLSTDPAIVELRGRLYKIGFTSRDVEKRLENVELEPTFLYAPVRIVTVFETVNLRPQKLEALLHQFFAHARLQVDVLLGRKVTPKEWFVVPIDLVREAITRILDSTIVNYRYDHTSRKIVPK